MGHHQVSIGIIYAHLECRDEWAPANRLRLMELCIAHFATEANAKVAVRSNHGQFVHYDLIEDKAAEADESIAHYSNSAQIKDME